MSTATVEQLQRIVSDENRTEQERRQAAEHILRLQQPEPAAPPIANDDLVRKVFAQMRLSLEEIEADEDERVAQENAVRKACPDCFQRQPICSNTCDLCGLEPDRWLPSEERLPRRNRIGDIIDEDGNVIVHSGRAAGGHVQAHSGRHWLRWASTDASVDELKYVASRFGAPDAVWQVKHAANVLRLRGEMVPKTFYGDVV